MEFVIGGLAGAGATIFTNPIDVIKTRMQLQGELRARTEPPRYRNLPHALFMVARTEGALALQKGLTPAMVMGFMLNGVRLGLYQVADIHHWTRNADGGVSVEKSIFWSSVSGALSGVACNPASVVKTRIQAASHPSIAVGRQYRYSGMLDAFIKIYKTEGLRGYYAGVQATAIRIAVGSAAQLTTFSKLKEWLVSCGFDPVSPGVSFVASVVCSFVVVCVETPLDLVNTRLYNQGSGINEERLYSGFFDCIRKIYKTEGLYGFYKGIGPLYFRIAPHTTLSLVMWDMLNNLFLIKQ